MIVFDPSTLPAGGTAVHHPPAGTGRQTYPIVVRLVGGRHVVRGVGTGLLRPGWPPAHEQVLHREDEKA